MKIFVVIPAYNEAKHISRIIGRIPEMVHRIIVVDDGSRDNTSEVVQGIQNEKILLIRHEKNSGVGGAMTTGYHYALKAGADIVVKLDGDGQMPSESLPEIIAPIVNGHADYSKGVRFHNTENLRQMPTVRLIGNLILSFLIKVASGYWNIFDPTSGYTAIHRKALSRIDLNRLARGYFFEIDMLIHLYRIQAVVRDVGIANKYDDEESQLDPLQASLISVRDFLGFTF